MGKCEICNKEFEDKYFDVEQNKCILHCEKDEKNGWYTCSEDNKKIWDNGKVTFFWHFIQSYLNATYINYILDTDLIEKEYILSNVVFPKFQDEVEYFSPASNEDEMGTNFYSYKVFEHQGKQPMPEVNTFFTKLIVSFDGCRFLDDANFKKYNFEYPISFNNCIFENEIELNKIYTNRVSFLACIMQNLNCEDIIFEQKVKIQNCTIRGKANFYNTTFKDLADFYRAKFNEVVFERADFEKVAVFSEAEFNKDVNFKYVKFLGYSVFRDAVIKGKLDLRNTIFDSDADANFLDITSEKRLKDNETKEFYGEPKVIQVANRETAKIIKSFYEYSNNIIEANKFYALEMKEREKELTKDIENKEKRDLKTFIDYIIFKLHGISSNHSQDPFLAFYWIIIFGITASLYEIYLLCTCSFSIINMITVNLFISAPIIINRVIETNIDRYTKYYLFVLYLLNYFFIVINCSPIKLENTVSFAKTINPFSIMKGTDDIDIVQLFFKITIAYLIYQFIVSVRQNTRRK